MTRSKLAAQTVSPLVDPTDLKILNALSTDPIGSIQRLSDLADVSPHTSSRRLASLAERKILLSVAARINLPALDLQIVPVLATVSFDQLAYAEKACDLHPYTRYRIRCLGATNGLFMLFGIPRGTEFQLIEFLDALVDRGIVKDYQISSLIANPIYTGHKFSAYDLQTDSWRFDWEKWAVLLNTEAKEETLRRPSEALLANLDVTDLKILRQLTIDARKEGKTIAKDVRIPEYNLSRRLKFLLENNLVLGHDVIVGRKLFRFAPGALFDSRCDLHTTRRIAGAVSKLPFQSSFFPTKNGFLLFAGLPTPGFTEMGATLLKHSERVGVMWTDYDTSMRYWFDETPFVPEKKQWNTDQRYVVDQPLSKLQSSTP